MRLAVCEAPPRLLAGDSSWRQLTERVKALSPDILLLNEMPFGQWVSVGPDRDDRQLLESRRLHEDGIAHLAELGALHVLGTQPVLENGRSVNRAYAWNAVSGFSPVHTKQFFPNEGGFYEARWFERGTLRFGIADAGGLNVGFLICTDVMFNEWTRYYGRRGAHLIAVPRATPVGSEKRWKTMMSAAAIVSGCYVASSNRRGRDDSGLEFAGGGWIFDPFGDLIAETSVEEHVVAVKVDLDMAARAQREYPCYVEDISPRAEGDG